MTKEELWQAVLGELELSISKANFTTWFRNTSIAELEKEKVVLAVPNIFTKEWLEKKYKDKILDSIRKFQPSVNLLSCVIGNNLRSDIVSSEKKHSRSIDSVVNNSFSAKTIQLQKNSSVASFANLRNQPNFFGSWSSGLNERYSFDNFIIGSNNELAYAACRSVANSPGKNYNPLFIYGGVGLGKTHMLQATGNQILKNFPKSNIRYTSMERFTNELLSAIQSSRAKEFKNDYIKLDVLILDDIQFLAGKEKTQEEFFHVFESLYQHGKQIILSSDRPPKLIPTLEDRLRSRFEGGMIADVGKPELETRLAIIKQKLFEKEFELDDDIINYLAKNIYHNIREIEGALNKIIAIFRLKNQKPTLEEIKFQISDLLSSHQQKDLTPEKIINSVAEFFDLKPEDIKGKSRKKKLVRCRAIAGFLVREELKLSYPEIGQHLGGRDHSTIIYALEKIKKELEVDSILQDNIKFIKEKFTQY